MAEQVTIPAGVNPANAVPPDASQYGSADRGQPGADVGIPPVARSTEQKPGFVADKPAPAPEGDAEYEAFKAWRAAQAKQAAEEQGGEKQEAKSEPAKPTSVGEGYGADGALDAVRRAGEHDPVIANTFEMIALVAPDVDMVRAIGNAIDRSDPTLIDKAYLREAGGDKADRLIALTENMVKYVNQQVEAITNDVYKAAGGEAQWAAASAAFNKGAPSYLKAYAVEALNSANPAKIREATKAILDFAKNSGLVPVPPEGHQRGGGGVPDASVGLSREQYQAERLKLNRFDRDYADKARELDRRRALGKKMGM